MKQTQAESDLRVAASVATSFVIGEQKSLRDDRESRYIMTEASFLRRQRAAQISLDWWDGRVSAKDREMVYRYLLDVAERWKAGPALEGGDE